MMRVFLVLALILSALPARAQVQCGAPITGSGAKFAQDYARNVTMPLIEHNAGGLGPVLWAYIAGQARAESLKNMQDKKGDFVSKPSNNLWNVQANATDKCTSKTTTIRGCTDDNRKKQFAESKQEALVLFSKKEPDVRCWAADENEWQFTNVCRVGYPNIDAAADDYLKLHLPYTEMLGILAKGSPSEVDFFKALKASGWSDQANSKVPGAKEKYESDTLNAIEQVLRGLATLREAETKALADTSNEINAWCSQSGIGDTDERAALSAKQSKLLSALTTIGKVCASPAGSASPSANEAINTCRMQPDQPAPPPSPINAEKPGGKASGTGDPHYRLPGGQTLTTQRAGEFWLLDSVDGTKMQVRQIPWRQSRQVTAIGAVAARIGAHRVGVYADGRVSIDSKLIKWRGEFLQQSLGNDAVIGLWGTGESLSQVAIMWRNGRVLRVHLRSGRLDVETSWTQGTNTTKDRGLIGRASSTKSGDIIGRIGRRGNVDIAEQADAFVTSWRIAPEESLFDYLPKESYATFDIRAFPYDPATPSQDALSAARAICAESAIAPERLAACAFDLAVTGSREFLESHRSPSSEERAERAPAQEIHEAMLVPDIANPVQTLPNGQRFSLNIGSDEQRTYRIDANRDQPSVFIAVTTKNLTCPGELIDGTQPVFQLFNARGQAISKATPTCWDLFTGDVEAGDYYVVVKGTTSGGSTEVNLEAFVN
jgi:hypothetical protein